ncbi:MAG: FKBP-type peptidyl-prolyl cis-trans isomerase [Rhodothermales bacterium]|nr:FKBP-type peptidyl-prolyl cis-trans isomerase [Rhodothermales bacterium]MBO6781324.1 FKBP-type peptidyl-prolyl cis-trans isomerase [Rhodothermales bacterium]
MRVPAVLSLLAAFLFVAGCDSGGSGEEGSLEVLDLSPGSGELVALGQTLKVNYEGRLEDGTVFDSTTERGEAWYFTMVEGQVIEGWLLGLPGMEVGGTRRLTIPAHLAFGREGRCLSDGSCPVPPNATVIYEVMVEAIVDDVIVDVVAEGVGVAAEAGRQVAVSYTGTFVDGQVFDSTEFSGQPFVFTLGTGQVIRGWDRGIIGMREGGVRRLVIPPHMAYGSVGVPGSIPPYTTLKFRVEMIKVQD